MVCSAMATVLYGQSGTEKTADGAYWMARAKAQYAYKDSLMSSIESLKKAHYTLLETKRLKDAIKASVLVGERYFVGRSRFNFDKAKDSAYSWMSKSYELHQKWPDSAGSYLPTIFRRKGDLLRKEDHFERGDSFLTQALVLKRKSEPSDTDFFVGCLYSKYFIAYHQNQLSNAKRIIDSIKPYCHISNPHRYYAYQKLSGRYFLMLGQPEKSVFHFTEASKVADKAYGKNSWQKLISYHNLYDCYNLLGNKEQSKAHLQKALEVAKDHNSQDMQFTLRYSLSSSYYDERKYRIALGHLKVLETQLPEVDPNMTFMALQRQPVIYQLLNKSDSAEIAADKLKRLIDQSTSEERGILLNRSASAKSLADYYRMSGQYDLAHKYAQISIEDVLKLRGRASAKSSRYTMKARIYQSTDSFEQALHYIGKALDFHKLSGDSDIPLENEYSIEPTVLKAYRFLSENYRMDYKKEKDSTKLFYFREYSKRVLDCITNLAGVVPSGKSKRMYRDKYKAYSENILYTIQETLNGTEEPNVFWTSQLLQFIDGSKSQELKWKITSDQVMSQNMGLPDSLKFRLMYLKALIANQERSIQSLKDSSKIVQVNDELLKMRDELKLLSLDIRDQYPSFYNHFYQPQKVKFKEILAVLPENQTVINFFVGDETVYGLAFNQQKTIFKELGHTDSLRKMVASFNRGIAKNDLHIYANSAADLYQWLLAPFNDLGLERLVIVPDGMLYSLAFDALLTENTNGTSFATLPYAIKKHFITLCYSAGDLIPKPKKDKVAGRNPLLAMGRSFDDDNESQFAYLPRALDEVAFSASLFDSELQFENEMATENLFKQRASNAEIIHCATHALVDQTNPMNSVLVLAGDTLEDGMLHLNELLNLNLNSSLVVLSACNTGSGYVDTTEGVISMGYAIAYAGCPNSMMTLWSSPDISNSEIVKSTMKLVSEGMNFDKALHQAKLDFLNTSDPVMASPLYWSAMNYTGQPDFGINRDNPYWYLLIALIPFLLLAYALYRYRS